MCQCLQSLTNEEWMKIRTKWWSHLNSVKVNQVKDVPNLQNKSRLFINELKWAMVWKSFNFKNLWNLIIFFQKDILKYYGFFSRSYLFIFRERGREGERQGNINVWLPLIHPPLGTWPTTQACAWLGIEPVTLWFAGWCLIHWAAPARANIIDVLK